MTTATVYPPIAPVNTQIPLASSKSESNRVLIINALTDFNSQIENLSSARDTQTMMRLLASNDAIADVLDAGTTMRFLTAYFAITNQQKTLTGTPRMCERPIGILVDALRSLGAEIEYLKNDGFPPFKTKGFTYSSQNVVKLRGDVSSQYISALLMVAPTLPEGIRIELTTEVGSQPYIEMTLEQMAHFGISYEANWHEKYIVVPQQKYRPTHFKVESDWSGASYWYSVVALAKDAEIELLGLKPKSLQGDSAIQHIMTNMGVKSTFTDNGVILTKTTDIQSFSYDFANCPDLVQTIAVCASVLGVEVEMTGIESLKIKETDRVKALQEQLPKVGGELVEIIENEKYVVRSIQNFSGKITQNIHTYDDHRMAMAFAPVGMRQPIIIEEPNVVAKSYPSFWEDLKRISNVEC